MSAFRFAKCYTLICLFSKILKFPTVDVKFKDEEIKQINTSELIFYSEYLKKQFTFDYNNNKKPTNQLTMKNYSLEAIE